MSEEKRQRIRDLARESTLIDAIDLAQQICETALAGGDTTDGGGTGPDTTDGGGTGPGTTDGGGTGPGTTDGGEGPPLPCTEFIAGCEYYYEGPDDGRTTTFDGECHDCVQSAAIPPEMNYSVVGSGFRTGTIYKVVNVHGTVTNAPLLSDNKTIDPLVYNRLESTDPIDDYITIEPSENFSFYQSRAPFLGTEYPYNKENVCSLAWDCDGEGVFYGDKFTVTDIEIFVQGFDFSKPNYGIDNPQQLRVTLDICPGPTTDDPFAPDPNNACKPLTNEICQDSPTIQFVAYVFFPGNNSYESYSSDTASTWQPYNDTPMDSNGWIPMYDLESFGDDFGRGFTKKEFTTFLDPQLYGYSEDENSGAQWAERVARELINPHTGTIIVRIVSSQKPGGIENCPTFNVHLNEIRACASGNCNVTVTGGMPNGQAPLDRPVYDCSDTPLVLNNANDTHVKLNSLVMNAPIIGNNWFENFLISENKNKPFISGSYLNSDYIETYPCFESLESSRFSDFLYPTVNDNNDNWLLQDLFQPPTNEGYISIQEEGIGGAGGEDSIASRVVSFTIHSSSGEDFPDDDYLITQYTLNPLNIPENGIISFDLEFTPSSDPYWNLFFRPIGYSITNRFGRRTVIYPNLANTPYSTSVSIDISPGDTLRLFVRRYIAILGLTRQYESSSLTVKNLTFESASYRYGQVISYIANLDYCNTNEGYDPNWPGTDKGTDFPIENGINGLKIIETMRAETNDRDLIIKRGMWLYNHTEEVWVGNPCGNVNEDIDLSPGIDLNTLHPYWKMRSKCKEWSNDADPKCIYLPENDLYVPIACGNPVMNKTFGETKYGERECTTEQYPKDPAFSLFKPGCEDFECCCQICNSLQINAVTYGCCGENLPYGWDDFCSSLARRFCGNDVYCEDTSFFPPSGYGLHNSTNAQTIPSGCCGTSSFPEPAFQFGTVDWTTHLNFESYDAKNFVDSNGKVTVCFVFTAYKDKNSNNKYELDEQGPKSQNSPYTIYIDRLRAVPVSSTEYIPPPDSSDGYSDPLIVLPPWLTDLIPDGSGTGTTDDDGNSGPGGGGGPTGPSV